MTVTEQGTLEETVRAYAAALAPAVLDLVRGAGQVPALDARLEAAGLSAAQLSAEDIARLPVLTKDEVLALQRERPPFGGMLAEDADIQRIFQSPGPIYEPQLAGPDPWRWAPALQAAGIGAGDTVLNCFGYHLSPAGAMFDEGCLAAGARVVPGGIGNQDLQAALIADVGVTAYIGLPSYLNALVERYDAAGLPRERWSLSKALVTAEPLPDSLRTQLQQRVPTVLMAYGTAEAGLIAYETEPGGGLVPAPGVHIEVCALDTGEAIASGEGQVVVTVLRPGHPLVRFGTGDLSAWVLGPRGDLRLAGVLGRVGEAVKVRGMFLHPRQARKVMDGIAGVQAWRFVVDRVDHRDELRCEVVAGDDSGQDLIERVRDAIRAGLRFTADVRVVHEIPAGAPAISDERSWE